MATTSVKTASRSVTQNILSCALLSIGQGLADDARFGRDLGVGVRTPPNALSRTLLRQL
jgi:hypothetical protein